MPLRLNGATSGYVQLAAPAVAGSTSLVLPTDSVQPGLVLVATSAFSAASTVSVDGCFTSTYENYRLLVNIDGASTTNSAQIRLRASGSDSAVNYNQFGWIASGGTLSANSGTGNTYITLATTTTTDGSFSVVEIGRPALAAITHIYFQQYASNTPAGIAGICAHTTSSAYDGFSVIASTGTITGRVRVYGYRNSTT